MMFMISKIQQAMQDDAIQTARIHPAFILVTGMNEVFIWQNFEPAYRDLSFSNRDLGMDTCVKRTTRVGPCLSLLPLFDSL